MIIKDVTRSISDYAIGFRIISKLKLWKYFFFPALIGLVVGGLIIGLALAFYDNLGEVLMNLYPFEWGADFMEHFLGILSGLLIIILGYIIYKHIIMAIAAPFMSPVSEKIESHLNDKESISSKASFKALLARGVRLAVRNITRELLFTIPLLLLSLIPLINLAVGALIFIIQAYYAGFGNLDYTLERHKNYKETITFVKSNKGVAIGNGIVFMLILLIPFIGILIVLPLSAAAGTVSANRRLQIKSP